MKCKICLEHAAVQVVFLCVLFSVICQDSKVSFSVTPTFFLPCKLSDLFLPNSYLYSRTLNPWLASPAWLIHVFSGLSLRFTAQIWTDEDVLCWHWFMMFDTLFQVIIFVVTQTVISVTFGEYWFRFQRRNWKTSVYLIHCLRDSECSYSLVSTNVTLIFVGCTAEIQDKAVRMLHLKPALGS